MGHRILIVDDDRPMRSFLSTILRDDGYTVEEAKDGREGLARIESGDYDLVITDLRMPDMSGIDLIRSGQEKKPDLLWIIITAYGSIGNAVEAMKVGAADYLTKPLQSPDELRHVVGRVLREAEAQKCIAMMAEELGKQYPPTEMIFMGGKMKEIHRLVEEVAPTTATVLITGPSGTGKELIARVIHQMSPRRSKPFVSVHCAALTETLLESELFGHERGAFTGAVSTRKGRFEMADGGTLFLDEVGEIPLATQVKLLRVLQEREFERVGGSKLISVDVRIITSTNRDLKEEIGAGRFREDLFYRLNVFPVVMPALSQRSEAILPLAEYFARKFSSAFGKRFTGFTPAARSALRKYQWPGNIRELQNIIERAVILSSGEIDQRHLTLEAQEDSRQSTDGLLSATERTAIEKTLQEVGGNRKQAAKILGISLRKLQYRIKEYNIKTAVSAIILILTAAFIGPLNPFIRTSYAQEKDTVLPDSGILYPGGYDLNTVGDIKGKISGIDIPGSGPVQLTMIVDKETYIVLASPSRYWKEMGADLTERIEVSVRGSKSMGKDGKLYIIAQELKIVGSKKTLAFRSKNGKALWSSGSQSGQTGSRGNGFGSQSGGSGSSSGGSGASSKGRAGGSSSGKGRSGR